MGTLIAAQGQPQQLWACRDASSPSGETLHEDPPSSECEATVSVQDRAETFAVDMVLGPAWLLIKVISGDD